MGQNFGSSEYELKCINCDYDTRKDAKKLISQTVATLGTLIARKVIDALEVLVRARDVCEATVLALLN